jgi:uncharacterized protein (DUF3084 family)
LTLNAQQLRTELTAVSTQYDQANKDFQDIRTSHTPLSAASASDRMAYDALEQKEKNLRIKKLELSSKLAICKIIEEAEKQKMPILL